MATITSDVRQETPQDLTRATNQQRVLAASALTGDRVRNSAGEDLGKIEEIMIDIGSGKVAYAVVSFGGFLGIGDKLFAVPWDALTINTADNEFVMNIEKQVLENAPGFDKDNWPDMADSSWGSHVHGHYGTKPYWGSDVTDTGDYPGNDRLDSKNAKGENVMPDSTRTETAPGGHTHFICESCGEHFHSPAELAEHETKCKTQSESRP